MSVNYGLARPHSTGLRATVKALTGAERGVVRGEEDYVKRFWEQPISLELYEDIACVAKHIGVTKNFREVIDYFKTPEGETPAGFRVEYEIDAEQVVRADLVRDIGYDKNGQKRATNLLFSADSANPYEVEPIGNLIANLTCNPGIIYDLFINNPKANVGNKFKNRDEVMAEIGRILGPGVDISVELNNPFEKDMNKILEEAARFREMLSPYRVVIKVPHTGPVNAENVNELLTGDKKFSLKYDQGKTEDFVRGHNLALMLRENGYRINFTLMFEPYQTALALQAKPYFINSFIRHRLTQSEEIRRSLDLYETSNDAAFLADLRKFFIEKDYLPSGAGNIDLLEVKKMGHDILAYRGAAQGEAGGYDGLDGIRHNLRVLRGANLPETRLIICSMEGHAMYPTIDKMLTEEEFLDMTDKVVITAEPEYISRFASSSQVISYQRRFMNAASGAK
ncbi:MAG: transaldolase family protein [Spirochaetaceae bacterium]|nr:transaldolase family protein [Spirochaetaceae bacterium]